jgi:hypothetical protein
VWRKVADRLKGTFGEDILVGVRDFFKTPPKYRCKIFELAMRPAIRPAPKFLD